MQNKEIRYGFQDNLSREFPSQIVVDVTELCNLTCIHCPQSEFAGSEHFKGRHLDPALHKKLIDEVATDGKGYLQYLRYTGLGETLLHPNFAELIEYAGKHSGVSINVTTNGVLLSEKMALRLLDAGVNAFDISIDAFKPETYAIVRKKGVLSVTKANVLKLIEIIKRGGFEASAVVSFIVQPENKDEEKDFERFWKEAGADYVVIRRLHSCSGAKKDIAKEMKKNLEKRRPCVYPWERLVLSPTGQIGYCPADWSYQAEIASFADVTIKEIWQGEFMEALRAAHLSGDFTKHQFCGQCPDWAAMRWPDEGRAYSNLMREVASTQETGT